MASARPDDSVAVAARRMRDRRVGSLVVVNELGQLVGIVTERDLVARGLAEREDLRAMRVADVMTPQVACCQADTPIAEANSMMLARNIRHMPVLRDGRPVGMISNRDLVGFQLRVTQAMRQAAEDVAQLIKSIKNLDLDEVLKVIAAEVPKMFQAQRWMLCMTGGPGGGLDVIVRQHGCHWGPECGLACSAGDGRAGLEADVPSPCRDCGAVGPRLVLPVGVEVGEEGLLCMCSLPEAQTALPEVCQYKARLVQDVLNGILANARLYERVRRRSMVDPLTGLKTRRVLEMKLAAECELGSRQSRSFCVAVIDVDHFKEVNDTYGHGVGDRILRDLADLFIAGTRSSDVATRFGGDEFVVVMPETSLQEAQRVLDRLRDRAQQVLRCPDGRPVTISCGVAQWSGRAEESGEDVLARADQALYEAKRTGRNTVASPALREAAQPR